MPRSQRLEAKRKLDNCRNHTAAIHYYLELLQEWYKEKHPEWAERFALADELNKELDNLILKMHEEL